MERKPRLPQLSREEMERRVRELMLRDEAQAVAARKKIRRARQAAAERFAEANAERRARAHRLIRLGAEVEASGLADLLEHDPEAVFGMLATLVENAREGGEAVPVARFAEVGRERRQKVAAAPSPDAPPTVSGRRRKKGRTLPGGRVAIRFPSPPPVGVRHILRALDYRWRLGLRSWVGDTPLDERATEIVRGYGGEILPGPDAASPSES